MKKKTVSAITGGAGGFGRATAIELGKKGIVLLGDFDDVGLVKAKEALEMLNIEVYTMHMDVRDKESCEAFTTYAASLGDLEYVVNIAGVCPTTSYTDDSISSPELTYTTNSIGTMYITDAAYNFMVEDGVLINFASMAGNFFPLDSVTKEVFDSCYENGFLGKLNSFSTIEGGSEYESSGRAYCVSKAFVLYYTKKNTKRFAEKGIRILSISPGPHYTRQIWDAPKEVQDRTFKSIAVKRWGETNEMGSIIKFICSEEAEFLTGVDFLVDGGATALSLVKQFD